jgi:Fic family protein
VINGVITASSAVIMENAALTKSSNDTALRDIQQLVERGVPVRKPGGGRSTS